MNRFITIQQTPAYSLRAGQYIQSGSFPIATEIDFVRIDKNPAGRSVGTLADGRLMFIDTLAPLLEDKVQVKATRLYPWLLLATLAVVGITVGYKKSNTKKKS